MRKQRAKCVTAFAISLIAMSFVIGCSHMEKSPPDRTVYMFIHKPLPEASRRLEEARTAGKDHQCPAEFNAARGLVDEAYYVYVACRTQEAISLAREAISRVNALCPKMAAPPAFPELSARSKVMVFPDAALFDFNSSQLKPEGKEKVRAYREQVQTEMSSAARVKISGHTDNVGSPEYNMKLSVRRAGAVRDYLVSIGVDPGKLEVSGEGMTRPVADNSTKKGRATNRRVEIEVIGSDR